MNGYVLDGKTGEPLPAVNIYESTQTGQPINNRGTITDTAGRFEATGLKSDFIGFSYVGYKPLVIPNRAGFVKIELTPVVYDLPGVVVRPPVEPPQIKPKTKNGWLWLLGLFAAYKVFK